MNNQDYKKAKAECWEEFKEKHFNGDAPWSPYSAFDFTFDRAYALGKQEKDADEISIDKEEYEELCKYRRYAANWAHGIVQCAHCGELNPSGCFCANCGKSNHHYYG